MSGPWPQLTWTDFVAIGRLVEGLPRDKIDDEAFAAYEKIVAAGKYRERVPQVAQDDPTARNY